jgi:plastocyanin
MKKLLLLIAVVSLVVAGPADAKPAPALTGYVGPGFTITLLKGTKKVSTIKAGTYRLVIFDKSAMHNFHLMGPKRSGYDKVLTSVKFLGKKVVRGTITLTPGTWTYVCDPHASTMHGSFRVTRR